MTVDGPRPAAANADFTRDPRIAVLSAMAVVVGTAGAGLAWVLANLIALATNLAFHGRFSVVDATPAGHALGPWLPLVPIGGGLVIGFLARYGSEKIRGHGIPEALEAILVGRSRMSAKVAVLKPLSSAISIGTGGPFGAEGPIIMTGGAFGSLFAQGFHLSSAERRTLLVAGAAAGMSAIFSAPLAAVLLAVELLLFEWRPRSFVPVALAAATAAVLRIPLLGAGAVFPVAPHDAPDALAFLLAPILGIAAGLGSGALTLSVYAFEDLFHRLPIHWMWWPAIGGAVVGLVGLVEPRALGIGAATIHGLLQGHDVGGALAVLLLAKALAWSFSLGSGTSGGVLAPLLLMGAVLGTVASRLLPVGDASLWAIAGMAATMGGTMRSPLTAIVFAVELTHDLALLPLLVVACTCAHGTSVLLLGRSILTEKVARRGLHVAREYSVDPFAVARVAEVMDTSPPTVPASTTVAELSAALSHPDSPLAARQATLVVDARGDLAGLVTRGDLLRAVACGGEDLSVVDAGSTRLLVAHPDESLRDALDRMLRAGVGRLPVVDPAAPRRVVGYLGRAGVLAARARVLEEEHVRERGYASRGPAPGRGARA
jgi:H+/Cl- antiporter ClcA/CBS domain-containing protein